MVIEAVTPEIDGGRFPSKRVLGELVTVEADIFADGHDSLAAAVLFRHERQAEWTSVPMAPLANDRWRAQFPVTELGTYVFTIEGWIDHFDTWRKRLGKRIEAGQNTKVEVEVGARMVEAASQRADGAADDATRLAALSKALRTGKADLDGELGELMRRHAERHITPYARELSVLVEPIKARCSTWYELFPRSVGKLRDVEKLLPEVSGMGFDVLYLPPIHPIGRDHRKGRNNAEAAGAGDPGSPWAIGAAEGGHTAVHPELGTFEDFRRLVIRARGCGLEIALDLAYQCAPDHPYVREHPEWFRRRPDGTIQYAENPPKKYQDIYPFDFDSADWQGLWDELLGVVRFWIGEGVRIFRVDNPHTKPFPFWEWLIEEIHGTDPDVLFLAEAFTRPKVMYRLAKLGFTQSYTYFTWRNTKAELIEYFTELTRPPVSEFFRPNLWPNTPDILHKYLQDGGRPAFAVRLVLAATLGANYGIYGPAYELIEHRSAAPGSPPPASEEYLNAEKYEIKHWDLGRPDSLRGLIAIVNAIRREYAALQRDDTLVFHGIDNDQLICYSKTSPDGGPPVLVVVNLDPHAAQAGWTALSLPALGLGPDEPFAVTDLVSGARYTWRGGRNYVSLRPAEQPGHIFRVERGP